MSILKCTELFKTYSSGVCALDNVNLELEPGKIVGLLGPNGSGKTTMIKIALGLLKPSDGSLLIDGKKPGYETKAMVAYLPDRDFLPNYMTIMQLIEYYSDFFEDFDINKAMIMLKNLNIDEKAKLKTLSKGTKEKVQLILTMSRNAKVYLLDEPIAGVDPAARDYIIKTIITNYNPNALVLISTHLISDIEEILDEVIFIKNGRIVLNGSADEIREKEGQSIDGLFREVFKC